MRRGIGVFLVVGLIGYFLSLPYLTLYKLNRACERGDTRAIRKIVDVQALTQNLKDQIRPIINKKMAQDLRDNPFAVLAQSFLDSILDRVIESLILNDEPCFVHGPTHFAKGTILGFASLDTFEIDTKKNDDVITLIFERQGLTWRLCNVIAPFDKIMKEGEAVNIKDKDGDTATNKNQNLLQAAFRGDLEEVKRLLNGGADINTHDNYGRTALLRAADQGHLEVVNVLLDKGADLNTKDNRGETALIAAVRKHHSEVANVLLGKGVYQEDLGALVLVVAAAEGRLEVVRLLLDKGTDVNTKDEYGRTALMAASWEGRLEVVKLLLDKGADVNAKDKNGYTAMRMATTNGGPEIVTYLEAHGAEK